MRTATAGPLACLLGPRADTLKAVGRPAYSPHIRLLRKFKVCSQVSEQIDCGMYPGNTGRQKERQTDRQTDAQTDRQTEVSIFARHEIIKNIEIPPSLTIKYSPTNSPAHNHQPTQSQPPTHSPLSEHSDKSALYKPRGSRKSLRHSGRQHPGSLLSYTINQLINQ